MNWRAFFVTIGGKITWEPYDPPAVCGARRGGPKSKVTCEMPPRHTAGDDDFYRWHVGRGQDGRTFTWRDPAENRLHGSVSGVC